MSDILFDYSQLFDLLQLDFLPEDDIENGDIQGQAVVEYYNYLGSFWPFKLNEKPEYVAGVKLLRKLLSDLGSFPGYISGVWKAMSEVENDESLLRISLPLIEYMWD
jgi:hypothetical protein